MLVLIRSPLRLIALALFFVALWTIGSASICTSQVYCEGRLLDTIQLAHLFFDSKTFVDMPAQRDPKLIYASFNQLFPYNNATAEELKNFVDANFYPAGSEVVASEPTDWQAQPHFVDEVSDPNLKTWALSVHGKWKDLLRYFNQSTANCPRGTNCYSSIQVPYPFIVAGGRFREYYYWDSFWIIEGLLVSEMYDTAFGMIKNFLYLVDQLGFVPNGGRVYYLNRSQPPVLTQMVWRYFEETQDWSLLNDALPLLEKEYNFWMTERVVTVNGYPLNIYNASNDAPRPESFSEDVKLAAGLSPADQRALYGNIATGAETGWDFSSRWFSDERSLSKIVARDIIPVDLNNILYLNEVRLAEMFALVGNKERADYYTTASTLRGLAMMRTLWNNKVNAWNDYNYVTKQHTTQFYPSNILPLWTRSYEGFITNDQLMRFISDVQGIFAYPGGVPTSFAKTGQQWDFPNAWPPLQYFVVEAFAGLNETTGGPEMAFHLAQKWITSNYCAWNETASFGGLMFEKYDATTIGVPGHGGEYQVQEGFGWTNGVVLHILKKYGSKLTVGSCLNVTPKYSRK